MVDLATTDVASLRAYLASSTLKVTQQLERVDINGNFLEDLTDYLVAFEDGKSTGNSVKHTSTDLAPRVYDFTIDRELSWGSDIVRPICALTVVGNEVVGRANGDVLRWRMGAFVASSPERDLVRNSAFRVQAYDKIYLLMSDVGATFSAIPDGTLTYSNRVGQLMSQAGIPGVLVGGKLNPAVVNFPTSWGNKIIPTTTETRVWPNDDSSSFQFIEIINALLKASGCRPMFTDAYGKFSIVELPKPAEVSPLWTFDRRATALRNVDMTLSDGNSRQNDVWNIPNQIVYVQSGLTYAPIEGSGQYTINNVSTDSAHYRPGPDQGTVGRVIRSVRRFDASGQDDLKKQAEADYTETYSNAETFTLSTTTWPVASHFDVFKLIDDGLPRVNTRKVETTSWELPLDGSAMTWNVRTVGDS